MYTQPIQDSSHTLRIPREATCGTEYHTAPFLQQMTNSKTHVHRLRVDRHTHTNMNAHTHIHPFTHTHTHTETYTHTHNTYMHASTHPHFHRLNHPSQLRQQHSQGSPPPSPTDTVPNPANDLSTHSVVLAVVAVVGGWPLPLVLPLARSPTPVRGEGVVRQRTVGRAKRLPTKQREPRRV